jgi:hypothetical protein
MCRGLARTEYIYAVYAYQVVQFAVRLKVRVRELSRILTNPKNAVR